jgi:signal transduction histidine kinase
MGNSAQSSVKLLLIEDSPDDAAVIREALSEASDAHYEMEWANRLSAGLEALTRQAFDLVLVDLDLPDSQGLDTVVRAHTHAPSVPLIVLTARDDQALAVQALQRGAQDYLVKGYVQVYRDLLGRAIRYAIERKRAQRELARLASFPEQHPDPIVETDLGGAVTYLNPAARAQFPELAGAREGSHPILSGLSEAVAEIQRDARRSIVREIACGGRIYEHRISFHSETSLVRSFLVDITPRKQMEHRERELSESVISAVVTDRKRAGELDQAYQELKRTQAMLVQAEKMAAVGQLASGIAHEVKNPLNILLQCVNYLEPELKAAGGRAAEVLEVMREAVVTSDKIIRGLLDFARPSPLELKPASLGTVIDASLALMQNQFEAKAIQVTRDLAPDLPKLALDSNQMQQVFINLFLNALHAMSHGGELQIRSAVKTLRAPGVGVGARTTDRFRVGESVVACEIHDTGIGIPKEVLSKVFDPFFTTKAPGQGVGLGLPICAAIIEKHQGLMQLESEEGRGTTVRILLPVSSAAQGSGGHGAR